MGENTMRIVILGKTGAGKSSVANTVFGDNLFPISSSAESEPSKCKAETKSVNGRSLTLIDTPGFFDTNRSEEDLKPEILRCMAECSPGLHAFLIVLKVEKFTEQEQDVVKKIQEYFSDEVFKYTTVLFTHGEQLVEGQTIDNFIHKNKLEDLVQKCGGRCHVIDNKYWNKEHGYRSNKVQVEKLLKTIEEMVKENGGYYTNEMLQEVEKEIQQDGDNTRLLPGNMSKEEIREQAKKSTVEKLLIKLAGAATGALLGAFFGVVGMAALLATIIQYIPGAALPMTPALGIGAGVGGLAGGVIGYRATEGANTPRQAMVMAKDAVKNKTESAFNEVRSVYDKHSQKPY